ncbi:unnamed protein product, partial [Discosporangium mesarthrocarpum]
VKVGKDEAAGVARGKAAYTIATLLIPIALSLLAHGSPRVQRLSARILEALLKADQLGPSSIPASFLVEISEGKLAVPGQGEVVEVGKHKSSEKGIVGRGENLILWLLQSAGTVLCPRGRRIEREDGVQRRHSSSISCPWGFGSGRALSRTADAKLSLVRVMVETKEWEGPALSALADAISMRVGGSEQSVGLAREETAAAALFVLSQRGSSTPTPGGLIPPKCRRSDRSHSSSLSFSSAHPSVISHLWRAVSALLTSPRVRTGAGGVNVSPWAACLRLGACAALQCLAESVGSATGETRDLSWMVDPSLIRQLFHDAVRMPKEAPPRAFPSSQHGFQGLLEAWKTVCDLREHMLDLPLLEGSRDEGGRTGIKDGDDAMRRSESPPWGTAVEGKGAGGEEDVEQNEEGAGKQGGESTPCLVDALARLGKETTILEFEDFPEKGVKHTLCHWLLLPYKASSAGGNWTCTHCDATFSNADVSYRPNPATSRGGDLGERGVGKGPGARKDETVPVSNAGEVVPVVLDKDFFVICHGCFCMDERAVAAAKGSPRALREGEVELRKAVAAEERAVAEAKKAEDLHVREGAEAKAKLDEEIRDTVVEALVEMGFPRDQGQAALELVLEAGADTLEAALGASVECLTTGEVGGLFGSNHGVPDDSSSPHPTPPPPPVSGQPSALDTNLAIVVQDQLRQDGATGRDNGEIEESVAGVLSPSERASHVSEQGRSRLSAQDGAEGISTSLKTMAHRLAQECCCPESLSRAALVQARRDADKARQWLLGPDALQYLPLGGWGTDACVVYPSVWQALGMLDGEERLKGHGRERWEDGSEGIGEWTECEAGWNEDQAVV